MHMETKVRSLDGYRKVAQIFCERERERIASKDIWTQSYRLVKFFT